MRSLVSIHTSSRNRFCPIGVRRISGGLPSGPGASPFFFIQAPIARLRNSGQVLQNVFVTFTGNVSPSISIRTTSQSLGKNRFANSRPTLTPRATDFPSLNFPLFQPVPCCLNSSYSSATILSEGPTTSFSATCRSISFLQLKLVYQQWVFLTFWRRSTLWRGLTVDTLDGRLGKDDASLELDFTGIEVNASFVHWHWCNARLQQLVNSHSLQSGASFADLFSVLRRESRLAELAWVSSLYAFKWLKEFEGKAGAGTENRGGQD